LAALVDKDAEFVNVTGLWWHDRWAIRKAHAYGLSVIFKGSTLGVQRLWVRWLSDEIAVVHAKMGLAGQKPLAGVAMPGARHNIFSFVVHRTPGGWRCASAHNTDIVPCAETKIVDDQGLFRSVNYRPDESEK
jgi:uncharacterized protein (TIGR02246 family)